MQKYQLHFRIEIPRHHLLKYYRFRGDALQALKESLRPRHSIAKKGWAKVEDFREPLTRQALDEALLGYLHLRNHLFNLFIFEASDPHTTIYVYCYPNTAQVRQAELRTLRFSDQIFELSDLVQRELQRAGLRGRLLHAEANQQVVRVKITGSIWRHFGRAIGFLTTVAALGVVLVSTRIVDGEYGRLASMAGGSIFSFFMGGTLTAFGFWFRHLITNRKREVEYHVVE